MFRLIVVALCIAHAQAALCAAFVCGAGYALKAANTGLTQPAINAKGTCCEATATSSTLPPIPNCRIHCEAHYTNPAEGGTGWTTKAQCVNGKDQLKLVNDAYATCKKLAAMSDKGLCECASNEWQEMYGCNYPWIQPWLATVQRDKLKYCGRSSGWSGGSSMSSSSGSEGSSGSSIGWSHQLGSQSFDYPFTWQQKALILTLIALVCCLCCGGCAVAYMVSKGSFKAKKTKPRDDFDDMQYQDYEQQQFDQGYPGDFPQEGQYADQGPVSDLPPALDPTTGQPLMS